MHFFELGAAIRQARNAKGLTQAQLAEQSDLSRVTVNQIENGAASDVGVRKLARLMALVGLELDAPAKDPRQKHDYLGMACTSANVSLKKRITPDDLAAVLITGRLAAGFRPHLRVVLEEVPKSVLEGVMVQVARAKSVSEIRANLAKVASSVGSPLRV